jgi:hypothetical protein
LFQNGKFWTAAASVARRRFGKRSALVHPVKALSSLRSASAVQKLPLYPDQFYSLFAPVGWRKQGEAVRLAMLAALVPQCLP